MNELIKLASQIAVVVLNHIDLEVIGKETTKW